MSLKGSFVPTPKSLEVPISETLQKEKGFHTLQTYHPGMALLCHFKERPKGEIWLDHSQRVIATDGGSIKRSQPITLKVEKNSEQMGLEIEDVSGFRKITHLLDPISWLQGKYSLPKETLLPGHQETWGLLNAKLQDPMNQAYIEAVATYCFSKLREGDFTPHFHKFYGAFCCVADTYSYNITDSYLSYRNRRWFWDAQEKKLFTVGFEDEDIPEEIRKAVFERPEELYESDDSEDDSEDDNSAEELGELSCNAEETGSLHSAHFSDVKTVDGDTENEDEDEDEDDEDDDDEKDDLNLYAEIHNFPVMTLYTELSEGTMDDLLDDFEEVGARPGTEGWDIRWKAWVFQVIAALSVGQSVFGFTHNDLHSNNIVWSKTDKEYLYYSCRDGLHFKVPTFGKIFRLIDFGRAIFRVNSTQFFSDDFRPGNDAAEQFNFGELYDPEEPEVLPNPSFDLSRFTVSVFEGIFPSSPPIVKKPSVLSEEKGLKMLETESDLYNVMWGWLLCDDGHNVLMEPDGKERYPDFDLYKVIAAEVHNAVPAQQIKKSLFECFRAKKKSIPEGTKVYSLFC
jgi:hypothetical protein